MVSSKAGAVRGRLVALLAAPAFVFMTAAASGEVPEGLAPLVGTDPKVEKLAGALSFTEGPVWRAAQGDLLFSDIPASRIVRWFPGPDGPELTTFRAPSGQSNGLALDAQERLLACEHGNRRVIRTEADGTVSALADRYEGKRLNSPNDLVVARDGSVYFTDPPYGVKEEERELDFQGVFRVSADGKKLTLLVKDFVKPNGLAFSPDGKTLYIADTEKAHIRAFEVRKDGMLGKGRVFAPIPWPDGMKVDRAGNVWCPGGEGVSVFNGAGKLLGVVPVPEGPANCAFGGPDGKTLFITARTGLYRVSVNVSGNLPSPAQGR